MAIAARPRGAVCLITDCDDAALAHFAVSK